MDSASKVLLTKAAPSGTSLLTFLSPVDAQEVTTSIVPNAVWTVGTLP